MKEEPSTPDDAFFKRVTNLVLIELAKKFPDQANRAAALLGLVVDESGFCMTASREKASYTPSSQPDFKKHTQT
jgi:hypothetical protein